MKPVIVGIDPGTTAAFAVIDLNGQVLKVHSKKEMDSFELKRSILESGKPLIIAVDKARMPQNVEKIAASFGCKIYEPDEDLSKEEKDDIVKKIELKNQHEKDALASALHAYKSLSRQFSKIDSTLSSLGLESYSDRIKEMISNKTAKNIAEAIEKVLEKKEEPQPIIQKTEVIDWKNTAENYQRKCSDIKKRYEILRIYSEKMDERAKSLEKQKQQMLGDERIKNDEMRKQVIKDKEIKSRDIMIKQLQYELKKERNASEAYKQKLAKEDETEEMRKQGYVPVIPVKDFSREQILRAHREFGVTDEIIWFENTRPSKQAARAIISLNPRLIIGKFDKEIEKMLKNAGLAIIDLIPEKKLYYASLPEEDIEHLIKSSERKNFLDWLESYRRRI